MISEIERAAGSLKQRSRPEGGFSAVAGGPFRPDCTAWAILALKTCRCAEALRHQAMAMLADYQAADGRVPLLTNFPEAYWPTALALLAWHSEARFQKVARKAINSLLSIKSITLPYDGNASMGHNSALSGWPWVEGTYAWVVPTSLAIIAMKAYGLEEHNRVQEGVQLLLDRQLPDGGWNYGDTFTFGTQLLPFPDTTGFALEALSGLCNLSQVKKSIAYLQTTVEKIRSPQSLAWAIFGLGAWSARPADSDTWITQSLHLQDRYGPYDTDLLAQIVLAYHARNGLLGP